MRPALHTCAPHIHSHPLTRSRSRIRALLNPNRPDDAEPPTTMEEADVKAVRPSFEAYVPNGNQPIECMDKKGRVQLPKDRHRVLMDLLHHQDRRLAIRFTSFFFSAACSHAKELLERAGGSDMEVCMLLQELMTYANIGDFRRKEFYRLVKLCEQCISHYLKKVMCVL